MVSFLQYMESTATTDLVKPIALIMMMEIKNRKGPILQGNITCNRYTLVQTAVSILTRRKRTKAMTVKVGAAWADLSVILANFQDEAGMYTEEALQCIEYGSLGSRLRFSNESWDLVVRYSSENCSITYVW